MVHCGIGLFNPTKRLARVAFLTAGLLARRFAQAADLPRLLQPVARRGFAALLHSTQDGAPSSAMRASCASSSAISSSFENWLNASRSPNSFESGRRSHVDQNLSRLYRQAEDQHALTA